MDSRRISNLCPTEFQRPEYFRKKDGRRETSIGGRKRSFFDGQNTALPDRQHEWASPCDNQQTG
jgi:hypothetical protein